MPYVADGEYHTRRRCRRLHRTSDRITRTDDTADWDPCPRCVDAGPETLADAVESGVCPWCDDYEGDHVGQHASSAHPDAWDEYSA